MLVHAVKLIYTTITISGHIEADVHSTFSARSVTLHGGTIRTILSKKKFCINICSIINHYVATCTLLYYMVVTYNFTVHPFYHNVKLKRDVSDTATIKRYPLILNLQYSATKRRQLRLTLSYVYQKKTVCQNKPRKQDDSF
jgi:hypothetical protein